MITAFYQYFGQSGAALSFQMSHLLFTRTGSMHYCLVPRIYLLLHNLDQAVMLLVVFYFVLNAFAAPCDPDGNHLTTCAHEKCEKINAFEVCTECKAGGVPIDGFCRPIGSPQVITAGCTKGDGTALEQMATTCGKCGSGYFLFMGGCYRTGSQPGSEVCTTAEGETCTVCNTANGLFKNPAAAPDAGRECLLCWDTVGANGHTGIENCRACTSSGQSGPATCSACKEGYYKDGNACTKCHSDCVTCSGTGQNACTLCANGKYLDGTSCIEVGQCNGNKYPNPNTGKCTACNAAVEQGGIPECTACTYDSKLQKPVCSACGGTKALLKKYVDGSTECVDKAGCAALSTVGTHFLSQDENSCILCSVTGGNAPDKGIAECSSCKKTDLGQAPTCTECLSGFYFDTTCKACGTNCATCSAETDETKCTTCKDGFFLAGTGEGKCISCKDGAEGSYKGVPGCSLCDAPPAAGPAVCKTCDPGYSLQGTTCVKACEDPTACGGTAGACDAMVIDNQGNTKHYCSYCGEENKFPIDGICVESGSANGNTCNNHVCESCTAGYFLYMGGCYKAANPPGNLMCTTAPAGICTEAASDKYFVVPGARSADQSVVACANPLGTLAGGNAYVGVDGCSTCTAPAGRDDGGMAVATCTACGEGKKPSKSGNGCVLCSVKDCKSCKADEKCEECSSGFSLENDKCVSAGASGGNKSGLSTGAIAGIAVAAIVVVGGLVGFLCWWFICRGKA
ncbi:VSP [Giardia lamblia P15]|uniref:VSP n=1 Tax=Giardia intestinalis (strain P15) TaxID=658858 RepID=E1EYP5_GIAIA|nr:VSP [Giardia lamblia P15]